MFSKEPSRMYAALRCIEIELERQNPRMNRIREIMREAGRELQPIQAQQKDSTVKPIQKDDFKCTCKIGNNQHDEFCPMARR